MSRCQFCGSDLYTGHSCPETGGAGSFLSSPTGAVAPVTFIVCPVCAEKDAEIVSLRAEIARLRKALAELLDYHEAQHRNCSADPETCPWWIGRDALGKEGA